MNKLHALRAILKDAGFQPKVQDDFVAFEHRGGHYLIPVDDEDPGFVRLIFPNFWAIEDEAERRRVLDVAALVHERMKNVKIFPMGAQTMASLEMLLPDVADFAKVFPRALGALAAAARNFQLTMQISRGDLPSDEVAIADLLRRMMEGGRPPERGREAG